MAAWIGLALLLAAADPTPKRVAVLDVVSEGGADPVIGRQMTNRLAEVVGRGPGVRVIAPDDIRALLEKEAQKQALVGCTEDRCLAEIAGALGADLLIQGRVSKIEDGFGVSLAIVNASTGEAVAHVSESWRGESIGLLELIVPMVDRALSKDGATAIGAIEVSGAPDGAQILVDDQVRGTAPAGQMGQVSIGARRVRVAAEGYVTFERYVVVKRGETTAVPVTLSAVERPPVYATWWFWTIAGVVVAGGVVGTALALGSGGAGSDPGATGVNVMVNAENSFTGGR